MSARTRAALAQWMVTMSPSGQARSDRLRTERGRGGVPHTGGSCSRPDARTGSGYGGKHTGKPLLRRPAGTRGQGPVKVVWSREEEFTWAYFGQRGSWTSPRLSKDGTITAWNIKLQFWRGRDPDVLRDCEPTHPVPSYASSAAGIVSGTGATANHFARESFMDELANRLKLDPLEFRLKNSRTTVCGCL